MITLFVSTFNFKTQLKKSDERSIKTQVYDVVIFIPDETRCIWQQRWSFGKAFYILARYGCFIDVAAILWC